MVDFLCSGCEELEEDGPDEDVLCLLTAWLLAYILFISNMILRVIITALTIAIVMLKLLEVAEIARYNS